MTDERLAELEALATFAGGDYYPDSGSAMYQREAVERLVADGPAIISELAAEVRRLKDRLNHQTEDDAEACRQGRHRDCGRVGPQA